MNALCWLTENDIIIRDIIDKIHQMAAWGNYEITGNAPNSAEEWNRSQPLARGDANTLHFFKTLKAGHAVSK